MITINDLSNDQRYAHDQILGWMRDSSRAAVLTLGGYAGSGKSTLVSLVAEQVDRPAFVAYTGKAASVLKRKLAVAGVETVGAQPRKDGQQSLDERPFCGTIHSLIYRPCDCREPKVIETLKPCPKNGCGAETLWQNGQSTCASGHVGVIVSAKVFEAIKPKKRFVYAEKDADGRCKHCGGKEWLRRDLLDRDYGLIIVDEASMVDDMMLRDLKDYGVPILAVGDHGQLPPVGGMGSLMRSPQLRLEQIHRQAEGNPIVALSKMIREEGRLPNSLSGDAVRFDRLRLKDSIIEERYADATPARLLEMGLACYTNRRRVGLNLDVRRIRGTARYGQELPRKGEHVVCLRNQKGRNGAPPIYNGMRGVLASDALPKQVKNSRDERISESETQLVGSVAFPEDGIDARDYEMLRSQFGRDKTFQTPEELERETGLYTFAMAGSLFDFGYAMTVHKMQGSQYDDLVVCAERPGPVDDDSWKKWLYTAVTRAAKKLTILR